MFERLRLAELSKFAKLFLPAVASILFAGCGDTGAQSASSQGGTVVAGTATGWAQAEPEGPVKPGLIVTPNQYDLGKVPVRSTPQKVTFSVENLSDQVLTLGQIDASCGCTVAVPGKTTLAPGESTTLTASVKIQEIGQKRSVLRVNAPDSGFSATAEILWEAQSSIRIDPPELSFGRVYCGQTVERILTVSSPDGSPISAWLTNAEVGPDAELQLERIDKGDTAEFRVDLTAANSRGPCRGTVVLDCSEPVGRINVPINWTAVEVLSMEPKAVFRGQVDAGGEWSATFLIRCRDSEIVEATSAGSPGFSAEPLKADVVSCSVSGRYPDLPGPFNIEFPVDVRLKNGQSSTLVFAVSGLVRNSAPDKP